MIEETETATENDYVRDPALDRAYQRHDLIRMAIEAQRAAAHFDADAVVETARKFAAFVDGSK